MHRLTVRVGNPVLIRYDAARLYCVSNASIMARLPPGSAVKTDAAIAVVALYIKHSTDVIPFEKFNHAHSSISDDTLHCCCTRFSIYYSASDANVKCFPPGFGLNASQRPCVRTHRTSVTASTSRQQAPRRRRNAGNTRMFFDFGKKEESNARPMAGGTVKGGKKV